MRTCASKSCPGSTCACRRPTIRHGPRQSCVPSLFLTNLPRQKNNHARVAVWHNDKEVWCSGEGGLTGTIASQVSKINLRITAFRLCMYTGKCWTDCGAEAPAVGQPQPPAVQNGRHYEGKNCGADFSPHILELLKCSATLLKPSCSQKYMQRGECTHVHFAKKEGSLSHAREPRTKYAFFAGTIVSCHVMLRCCFS